LPGAVGLVGKVVGPVGLAWLVLSGRWPPSTVVLVVTNDLIWWAPFALYLYDARRWRMAGAADAREPARENRR
jgi:hypothetical protein